MNNRDSGPMCECNAKWKRQKRCPMLLHSFTCSYLSGQASPIFLTASSSFGMPVEYPGGGIENCVPLKPLHCPTESLEVEVHSPVCCDLRRLGGGCDGSKVTGAVSFWQFSSGVSLVYPVTARLSSMYRSPSGNVEALVVLVWALIVLADGSHW